jgi:hypothetical protein
MFRVIDCASYVKLCRVRIAVVLIQWMNLRVLFRTKQYLQATNSNLQSLIMTCFNNTNLCESTCDTDPSIPLQDLTHMASAAGFPQPAQQT